MSQRSSRTPVAILIVAFTLCLSPAAVPSADAGPRARLRLPQTESRLLDHLDRWRTALWQDVVGLWGKAGARIDDNGKA